MKREISQREISRREFLKNTAAVSGGLTIALYLPGCSKPEQAATSASTAPGGDAVANAWLHIGSDGSIKFLCDRSEMGQGVYTGLTTLIAEELGVEPKLIKVEFAPPGAAYVNSLLGAQVTGGSTSVRDAWEKLRKAGAEARERLIAAGAKKLRAQASLCRVVNEGVAYGNKVIGFGEIAADAAALPAPQNVSIKQRDFKFIGKAMTRLDTPSKVDGSAQFGIDMRLPGMLYAALAQSPVLGGSVKSVNADKAKTMPGVKQVLQTSSGVVVIADTWWQARQARNALDIQWDAGPNAKLNNAAIMSGLSSASEAPKSVRRDGDADSALKASGRRLSATYSLPLLAHATMEPQNCTVEFRSDGCHVYAPTQVQQLAQAAAMKAAGLPENQVFVHTTFLGGGFGRRLEVDFVPAAVEAAKAAQKPVKLLWTREDDMTHDAYRPPARDTVSGSFDVDGRVNAFKLTLVGPSITSRWAPAVVANGALDPFAVEAAQNFPYSVPNVAIDYVQHEIGITVGYWRSVSHALNCFVIESFIDELANDAQDDSYMFRRKLLWKQKDPRWQNVLDAAARKAGWGEAPKGHFQGIALMSGYDTYMAQVAEISLEGGKLKVHRIVCAVDCGRVINPGIVASQVESSVIFGLSAALFGEINIDGGKVKETNFDSYRVLRMSEVPKIETHLIDSDAKPGGMGEPATALVAPALCNAIHKATGKRLRALPIVKQGIAV